MTDTATNGTTTKPSAPPASMREQCAAALKATITRIGLTKKTSKAKREYLSFVKAYQGFAPEDRATVRSDFNKLADLIGNSGDNDAALTAARLFVGSDLS